MSIHDIDFNILKWIHSDLKNDVFDSILPYVRNKLTWIPLYAFFAYYLYQKFNKRMILICIGLLVTIALSDSICSQVLKNLFQRIRPCHVYIASSWFSDFHLCSETFSMPSCHAANHMAFSTFIWHFFRRSYRMLFIAWVLLIGFSQVYVGVHYPADIFVGMICGGIIGHLSFKIYNFVIIAMNIN